MWIDDVKNEISKNTGRTAKVRRYVVMLLDIITWRTSVVLISQQSRNYLVVIWFVIGLSTRIVHKVLDANFWEETVVINLGRDQVRRICWTIGNFKIISLNFAGALFFKSYAPLKNFPPRIFAISLPKQQSSTKSFLADFLLPKLFWSSTFPLFWYFFGL